jgi:hypothetical protein
MTLDTVEGKISECKDLAVVDILNDLRRGKDWGKRKQKR